MDFYINTLDIVIYFWYNRMIIVIYRNFFINNNLTTEVIMRH